MKRENEYIWWTAENYCAYKRTLARNSVVFIDIFRSKRRIMVRFENNSESRLMLWKKKEWSWLRFVKTDPRRGPKDPERVAVFYSFHVTFISFEKEIGTIGQAGFTTWLYQYGTYKYKMIPMVLRPDSVQSQNVLWDTWFRSRKKFTKKNSIGLYSLVIAAVDRLVTNCFGIV